MSLKITLRCISQSITSLFSLYGLSYLFGYAMKDPKWWYYPTLGLLVYGFLGFNLLMWMEGTFDETKPKRKKEK